METHEAPKEKGDARLQKDAAKKTAELAGKYMSFKLANETYGIEVLKVRELIRCQEITRVPGTKSFIRGVINLRGKVIPVVDPRLKFRMAEIKVTRQTVIIVVQYTFHDEDLIMGMLVDEVLEVLNIAAESIEPPPNFGTGAIDTDYILGVGKSEKKVVLLMDIGKVLTAEEALEVSKTATTTSGAEGISASAATS